MVPLDQDVVFLLKEGKILGCGVDFAVWAARQQHVLGCKNAAWSDAMPLGNTVHWMDWRWHQQYQG